MIRYTEKMLRGLLRALDAGKDQQLDDEEILSPEWTQEVIERAYALHLKSHGDEAARRELESMRRIGIIIEAVREGHGMSRRDFAVKLGEHPSFVPLLENGFVSLKELNPRIRDRLGPALDLPGEIVDLLFEEA